MGWNESDSQTTLRWWLTGEKDKKRPGTYTKILQWSSAAASWLVQLRGVCILMYRFIYSSRSRVVVVPMDTHDHFGLQLGQLELTHSCVTSTSSTRTQANMLETHLLRLSVSKDVVAFKLERQPCAYCRRASYDLHRFPFWKKNRRCRL